MSEKLADYITWPEVFSKIIKWGIYPIFAHFQVPALPVSSTFLQTRNQEMSSLCKRAYLKNKKQNLIQTQQRDTCVWYNNMINYTWTAKKLFHIFKTIKSVNEPQLILL